MALGQMAPSHYLIQCWFIRNGVFGIHFWDFLFRFWLIFVVTLTFNFQGQIWNFWAISQEVLMKSIHNMSFKITLLILLMHILGANELTQKHSVVADPHILCTNGMVSRWWWPTVHWTGLPGKLPVHNLPGKLPVHQRRWWSNLDGWLRHCGRDKMVVVLQLTFPNAFSCIKKCMNFDSHFTEVCF